MKYEYLFVEIPHDKKTRAKVGGLDVDQILQVKTILDVYGQNGWRVVNFSQSFTGAGIHFPAKFLLERPMPEPQGG